MYLASDIYIYIVIVGKSFDWDKYSWYSVVTCVLNHEQHMYLIFVSDYNVAFPYSLCAGLNK